MEDIKLSLFGNNIIIFVENQKELTKYHPGTNKQL